MERKNVNVILACTEKFGIGYKGTIPWHCPEELKLFKQITDGHLLIVGRITAESLPNLPNRVVYCVSRRLYKLGKDKNDCCVYDSVEEAVNKAYIDHPNKKIFIAGGEEVYKSAFNSNKLKIERLYVSTIHTPGLVITCDRFFDWQMASSWYLEFEQEYGGFTHRVFVPTSDPLQEQKYINLLQAILDEGSIRVGRNGETKSIFHYNLSFDLTQSFPLLTTKKMFFRGIVEELLFFLRGDTDTKKLEEKGINIWSGNTNRAFLDSLNMKDRTEGLMGPMYGYQWRNFNAPYDEEKGRPITPGIDQLRDVINTIKTDPTSRRILFTDFNPAQAKQGVLYPCHSLIIQFYVDGEFLDLTCYNRSQDAFLGVPFNIASTALLLTIIAQVCGLTARHMHITMGDVHIYKEHYDLAQEQIKRYPYVPPKVIIKKELKSIEDIEALQYEDFELLKYKSHPAMKAEMKA
jgi:thymidylate synthase